jgi:hypothetical protein
LGGRGGLVFALLAPVGLDTVVVLSSQSECALWVSAHRGEKRVIQQMQLTIAWIFGV